MQRRNLLLAALGSMAGSQRALADDVLDRPARPSALADKRQITAIARAGQRLVAVGQRGHVVVSDDGGRQWSQAAVPVGVDLTAVFFTDRRNGYATGHDGVVLGSRDGGDSWTRLLDGRRVNALVLARMAQRAAAADATEQDRKLLDEARRNSESGPDKPFLDVFFLDADQGFVVGAYGLVLRTVDGGRSWESWFDRVENPGLLNLYAIGSTGGALFIAGEAGLLAKLDPRGERFRALPSGSKASFFGLLATSAGMLGYGMRGSAFLSTEGGANWTATATGLSASVVGGAVAADGTVALVDQGGGIVLSRDGGRSFAPSGLRPQMPLAAVAFAGDATLVLGGPRGLRTLELTPKDKP